MNNPVSYFNDTMLARVTRSQRAPDFIGIGAQKSGTTWLYRNLEFHPELFMPRVKELQYFNEIYLPKHREWISGHRNSGAKDALSYYLNNTPPDKMDLAIIHSITSYAVELPDDEWYRRMFAVASPSQICGEITPEYSLLPPAGVAHAIKISPHAKIIFLLRDPIERNWSHIRMIMTQNPHDEHNILEMVRWLDVVERARYGEIFRRWSSFVAPSNIYVDTIDQIAADPMAVLKRISIFLGIRYLPQYFNEAAKPVHVGERQDPIPDDAYQLMRQQLEQVYNDIANTFEFGAKWRKRHY